MNRRSVQLLGTGVFATGMICAAELAHAQWDPSVNCINMGKGKQTCIVYDNDEKKVDGIWNCKKHKNGTWSCVQARTYTKPEQVPPELKKAITAKGPRSKRRG